MSVDLNDAEVDLLLRAHPPGTPQRLVVRLGRRVTTAGRDGKDERIVQNKGGSFHSLLTLCRTMSQQTGFGTLLLSTWDNDTRKDRRHFVAILRYMIETLANCGLMWWRHLLVDFAKFGLDEDKREENCARADRIVKDYTMRMEADSDIQKRVAALLRPTKSRRIDDPALILSDLEDVWTVLLHSVFLYSASKCRSAVLMAGRPEPTPPWQLNPQPAELLPPALEKFLRESSFRPAAFCACHGATLALGSNGGLKKLKNGQPDIMANPTIMTQLLSLDHPPMAKIVMHHPDMKEGLLRLFLQHRCTMYKRRARHAVSDCRLLSMYCCSSSENTALDEDLWEHVCALTRSDPASGPAFTDTTQSILKTLVAFNLRSGSGGIPAPLMAVSWTCNGQAEPDDFESHGRWTELYRPKVQEVLLATGLYTREPSGRFIPAINHGNSEDDSTDEPLAAAMDLLATIPWFVSQTASTLHCMGRVRQYAVTVLMEGMKRDPARFRPYWTLVLGMEDGPPTLCTRGFQSNMLDANCMSCQMPADLCPSIARLRAEVNEWVSDDKVDSAVQLHRAPGKDPSVRDLVRMVSRFQGTVPNKNDWATVPVLHEAADHFLESKLVVVDGGGRVPWRFTKPRRIEWTNKGPAVIVDESDKTH